MLSDILIFGDRHYIPDQNNPDNRFRFFLEDKTGKMVIQYTRDGGSIWRAMASEAPSNVSDGWVPVTSGKSLRWIPFANVGSKTETSSSNKFWIDFMHPGDIVDMTMFGAFKNSIGPIYIRGMQVSCFIPPSSNETVKVQIVSSANKNILYSPSVLIGDSIITNIEFQDTYIVPKETTIRAMVITTGSMASFMTVRALIEKE